MEIKDKISIIIIIAKIQQLVCGVISFFLLYFAMCIFFCII